MSEPSVSWPSIESFIPRGESFLWSSGLVWMNVVTDILIASTFLTIPILLLYIRRRRHDFRAAPLLVTFTVLAVAFAALSLLDIVNIWKSLYWLEVAIKIVAALASLIAAALMWRALPTLLSMPSERQLRETNASLERATRELEAFTASVSHDLRSPLTTIAGQAGLLELSLNESATDDQRRRLLRIQTSVKQMSELIDALLVLSRISRYTLHREVLDLSEIAENVIAELHQNDPLRKVQVTIQPGITVHGDRRLISDLLTNLLGNAWKFTSKNADSRIEIGVSTAGYMATLHVRDNGAGFDMAYAQKLFKPFQRLHSAAEFGGSGIGLATVARIIERHGGRIWAESQPQQGAVFYFTLPTLPITDELLVGPRHAT